MVPRMRKPMCMFLCLSGPHFLHLKNTGMELGSFQYMMILSHLVHYIRKPWQASTNSNPRLLSVFVKPESTTEAGWHCAPQKPSHLCSCVPSFSFCSQCLPSLSGPVHCCCPGPMLVATYTLGLCYW